MKYLNEDIFGIAVYCYRLEGISAFYVYNHH